MRTITNNPQPVVAGLFPCSLTKSWSRNRCFHVPRPLITIASEAHRRCSSKRRDNTKHRHCNRLITTFSSTTIEITSYRLCKDHHYNQSSQITFVIFHPLACGIQSLLPLACGEVDTTLLTFIIPPHLCLFF